jgi:hypothetical protein
MTWTLHKSSGEVVGPNGDVVATIKKPFQIPRDVQRVAESAFRDENMAELSTDRIADYAEAWMGDIEVVA